MVSHGLANQFIPRGYLAPAPSSGLGCSSELGGPWVQVGRLGTSFEQVVRRGLPSEVTCVLVKALPEQRDPKVWWGVAQ